MRDYMRCSDLQRLTDDVVSLYDDGTSHKGAELYVHQVSHG